MSKLIYEEAIEILANMGNVTIIEVIKALKQAQKQEKLLELYIDLGNTIEILDNAYGYGIFEFGEIKYICNKIKEELK